MTCPKSHSKEGAEVEFELRSDSNRGTRKMGLCGWFREQRNESVVQRMRKWGDG